MPRAASSLLFPWFLASTRHIAAIFCISPWTTRICHASNVDLMNNRRLYWNAKYGIGYIHGADILSFYIVDSNFCHRFMLVLVPLLPLLLLQGPAGLRFPWCPHLTK